MVTRRSSEEVSLVPAARSVPFVAGDTPAMREWAEQLVARARAEGVDLTGDDGLLTAMVRQVLQTGLEVAGCFLVAGWARRECDAGVVCVVVVSWGRGSVCWCYATAAMSTRTVMAIRPYRVPRAVEVAADRDEEEHGREVPRWARYCSSRRSCSQWSR